MSHIKLNNEKALVVFSGGQDSTTCLFWAQKHYQEVEAVFFHYGQRHHIEYESAKKIASMNNIKLHELHLDTFKELGGNSLLDHNESISEESDSGLPNTFVPGRNLIFLTYAAALSWKIKAKHLVTGVCQTDFSGYPDCRQDTIEALEKAIQLGIDCPFEIHTPLMYLTKAETVKLAQSTGGLSAQAYSHTCYEGAVPPCGKCPSCQLRSKGFKEAGIEDPLVLRTQVF